MRWLLFLVLGCAEDRTPTAEGEDAGPTGCQKHSECGEGWCVGSSGCDGTPWQCTEEIPCSAAAPFMACTCAGIVADLAAGCPGPPYGADVPWATAEILPGEPCDPAGLQPLRYDLTLTAPGFEAFEGQRAQARLFDPGTDRFVGEWRTQITGGRFEYHWPGGLRPGIATHLAVFLVDADGTCRPEQAWTLNVPAAEGPHEVQLDPSRPVDSAVCQPPDP